MTHHSYEQPLACPAAETPARRPRVRQHAARRCLAVPLAALLAIPAAPAASAAQAGDGSTGTGIGAWPVCLSTPAQPGHAYQLGTGGTWGQEPAGTSVVIDGPGMTAPGHGIHGVDVQNAGDATEAITLSAVQPGGGWPGARPVPSSWIRFAASPVTIPPGDQAWIPVTVTVPPGAQPGTYAASVLAATAPPGSSGSGASASLGAGAETPLLFTVGITRPAWPPLVMHRTDPCWAPPGQYESWQQWSGAAGAAPPPGWAWGDPYGGREAPGTGHDVWYYTPPPGNAWSYPGGNRSAAGGWAYTGSQPASPCVTAAAITARGWYSAGPGGGPWTGTASYPDTSNAAGCSAWLRASADGTLTRHLSAPPASLPAQHQAPGIIVPAAGSPASTRPSLLAAAVIAGAAAAGLAALARRKRRRTERRGRGRS